MESVIVNFSMKIWTWLIIILVWSAPVMAQEDNFNFEITPYGAYRFGGEFEATTGNISIEVDDNSSYGLILNARHSPITQWEILYSHQETSADTLGLGLAEPVLDVDVDYLHAGGTYLWDGDHVRPFLSATLGITQIDISTPGYDSDSFFSFSVGLGLQVRPTDRLGIRLEARSFGSLLDSDTDLFCQTGPANNICAVRIDGTVLWQLEAIAGIVFRF
jgi:hypothetical protein